MASRILFDASGFLLKARAQSMALFHRPGRGLGLGFDQSIGRSFQTGAPSFVPKTKVEPISKSYKKGEQVKWCACGLSKSQPHCDGSHVSTDKTPIQFVVPETKSYSMCVCKKSTIKPFCDDHACRKL